MRSGIAVTSVAIVGTLAACATTHTPATVPPVLVRSLSATPVQVMEMYRDGDNWTGHLLDDAVAHVLEVVGQPNETFVAITYSEDCPRVDGFVYSVKLRRVKLAFAAWDGRLKPPASDIVISDCRKAGVPAP